VAGGGDEALYEHSVLPVPGALPQLSKTAAESELILAEHDVAATATEARLEHDRKLHLCRALSGVDGAWADGAGPHVRALGP
jgi:hypothetical protein